MKKPKLQKYPTGGEKPTINTVDDYNKELLKYKKIPTNKVPLHIAMYTQDVITPTLKNYNAKLDSALRAKYKLDPKAAIADDQILTPMEATKVLGNDNYKTYDSYRNAYNSYRDKTNWEARKSEELKFAPSFGDTVKFTPAYDKTSSTMFNPYPTFSHGGTKLPKYYNGGEPVAPAAYEEQTSSYQPNYNAMVGASSMATANFANVYQDPNATTSDKTASARQGAAQIAGSINPIVGGIIGGVDAIAAPIKNNAEQTNSQGQLTNRNKARASAIAGSFLSPSSAITTMASGKWDLKGDKYLNEIEGNAQAQLAAEQAPMLAAAEAKRNMYYTYAQGGVHQGMPNAEVEKEEVMRMPDGGTIQVDGPSHAQGGVPVNIPDGTQIFSDRLKDPITKKTFAKMAEKYKTNKQEKVINDPKANKTAKSTAELVAQIKQAKLDKLFETQEQLKQAKLNKYAQKLGIDASSFANGGTKLPKYADGRVHMEVPEDPEIKFDNFYNSRANMASAVDGNGQPIFFDNNQQTATDDLGRSALFNRADLPMTVQTARDSFGYNTRKPTGEFDNLQSMPTLKQNQLSEKPVVPSTPETLPITKVPGTYTPEERKKMNPNWMEPATNTLMQNIGNLSYLKDQGKQYDKQDFYKYSPELYNPADALRQADIEARVTRDRLKDASGGNAGALMSNLQQSQALNTLNKSKIRTDASNMNNQVLNDAQLRNIAGKYQVDDINARNKGQALTNYYKAIQGIGTNTSAAYADWKRGNMDQNTAKFMGSMFKNYGLDINNPNDWKLFYKKASNTQE